MLYSEKLAFITEIIKQVYSDIISNGKITLFDKSEYDEVTSVDYSIEKQLIAAIHSRYPEDRILSEEFNHDITTADKTWIIDPIDGTGNFSHGISTYGVQCAYFDGGDVQLSAIYLPFSDEMFTAVNGGGSFCNGEEIQCSNRDVCRCLLSFGDFVHGDEKLIELEQKILHNAIPKVERIRMYGAASIDFAFAACGRLDGSFTFVKNAWDIMPGILLCREAGMIITDAYGKKYEYTDDTVAVFSTEKLKDECTNF